MLKSIKSTSSVVKTAIVGTLAPLLVATCMAATQPNVLILYADDLGYGDLNCYASESKIPTPNIDQLASEGMRFTDGHSSSGICTPSRYALLTGRHHWRDFHGIVNAMGNSVFKSERLTFPEMMQEKGYHTAAIGKWHLGWGWNAIKKSNTPNGKTHFSSYDWSKSVPDGPLAHGFDYYFGDSVINFPPYAWIENDKLVQIPNTMLDTKLFKKIKEGSWEMRKGPMVEGWDPYENIPTTTAKGVEFIKQQAKEEKPFFLYFAYPSPHAPIIPNDRFDGKSGVGSYGDLVVETDDSVGQLLKALKDSGQEQETIVIFTADNGPENYAYARDAKFDHWSAAPLRGLKRDIYEGGHRVPFIIKYPGVAKAGSVSEALVSQIDLMATVASVIGYRFPDKNAAEDSHDLLPVLKSPESSVRSAHVHNTYKDAYAMRQGDWVLVAAKNGYHSKRDKAWEAKHGYSADSASQYELYNIKEDLGQRHDLANKYPEKVKTLQALLTQIQDQGYSAPRLAK